MSNADSPGDAGNRASPPDETHDEPNAVGAFLNAIHGDHGDGFIEVRLIEDRKGGSLVDRRWYSTAEALGCDLGALLEVAEQKIAAIYFGVLRRHSKGSGTVNDSIAGVVVWCDLDFKDFAGGEAEARRRLAELPLPPSIIVRSGHGLHAYWLLREPEEPEKLSALSKAIARAVGGDHAFDAARILRLPYTYNRKDPANPILVEIETFERDRRFNLSEIENALEMLGAAATEPPPRSAGDDGSELTITDELPPRVAAMLMQNKRLGLLFNGEGKPELGLDGRPLDKSSSGYDFSLALALAKAGIRDPSDLASALWHRPDGAAQAKGVPYIVRTIGKALQTIAAMDQESVHFAVGFKPERVRIFDSNPARYEFTVQGISFTVTSAVLWAPRRFAVAFMDALHRAPRVPLDIDDWTRIVNHWLKGAEVVAMPPDASYEPALRESTIRVIGEMPVGDAAEDLNHGKAVKLADGANGFKVAGLMRRLKDDFPDIDASEICRVLRSLGYVSQSTTVDGEAVRVWRSDRPTT